MGVASQRQRVNEWMDVGRIQILEDVGREVVKWPSVRTFSFSSLFFNIGSSPPSLVGTQRPLKASRFFFLQIYLNILPTSYRLQMGINQPRDSDIYVEKLGIISRHRSRVFCRRKKTRSSTVFKLFHCKALIKT